MGTETPTDIQQDKQVTIAVPEDRVAEFYAFYARFLAAERGEGRGRRRRGGPGRHGHGPGGHRGHGCGKHRRDEDVAVTPAQASAEPANTPADTPEAPAT